MFKAVQPVLRDRVATVLEPAWRVAGWVPFGADGTHVALPRTAQLERRFGRCGKGDSAPQLWVTTLVHLPTGVLWSWQVGRSKASEREHLSRLVPTLPTDAMVVADAGFVGYDLWHQLDQAGHAFLIRVHSKVHLYADWQVDVRFREGRVYVWPSKPRRPPMALRLIRLPARRPGGDEVWLVTNVLESHCLSRRTAGLLYKMRWEQEVFYRGYKCTLNQAKLASRSVTQVIREVEVALLATQLILAQSAWSMVRKARGPRSAMAEAMRQIRREYQDLLATRLRTGYLQRLADATREERSHRSSSKQHRSWPRKKPHQPPRPPKIITMTSRQKLKLEKQLLQTKRRAS
jgi:hypothetical protein